jgi:uncharacterized membrane protein (UPF0127 family)
MRRVCLVVLSITLCIGASCERESSFTIAQQTIMLADTQLRVYLADTSSERSIGLGDTASLAADEGMLFIWPQASKQYFWMKDVDYPLDIVWLKNQTVIGTDTMQPEAATTPLSDYRYYPSPDPVNQVLELPAGTVQNIGLKIGDKLTLQ